MKYFLPVFFILLTGLGCNSEPLVTTSQNNSQTNPATTTPAIEKIENVQNFGEVSYVPMVVGKPGPVNPDLLGYDLQGWWKIGTQAPGENVYVLIEGTDSYFYASNDDRSAEARGHWDATENGELIIETPERVLTTFDSWVYVDENTVYLERAGAWEKWELVDDPMLP